MTASAIRTAVGGGEKLTIARVAHSDVRHGRTEMKVRTAEGSTEM